MIPLDIIVTILFIISLCKVKIQGEKLLYVSKIYVIRKTNSLI